MRRALAGIVAVLIAVGLGAAFAPPASAATAWSRSTTGAAGSGTYSRSHQTYTMTYKIRDTVADGDCAYVVFRPEVQWASKVPGWLSVGISGYEKRHTVCGKGKSSSGTDRIDVWAHMSALDHQLANKMRMRIKVCRDISWHRDNCSEMVTGAVDI